MISTQDSINSKDQNIHTGWSMCNAQLWAIPGWPHDLWIRYLYESVLFTGGKVIPSLSISLNTINAPKIFWTSSPMSSYAMYVHEIDKNYPKEKRSQGKISWNLNDMILWHLWIKYLSKQEGKPYIGLGSYDFKWTRLKWNPMAD